MKMRRGKPSEEADDNKMFHYGDITGAEILRKLFIKCFNLKKIPTHWKIV